MRHWSAMSLQLIALIVGSLIVSTLLSSVLMMNNLPVWWMMCIPVLYLSTLLIHRFSGVLISLGFGAYFFIMMAGYEIPVHKQFIILLLLAMLTILAYLLQVGLFRSQFSLSVAEARVNQLIAVDPETGFDNRNRFFMDLDAERDRLIRNGGTFVVTLPLLNDFEKHYGRSEYEWFLDYFSDELHEATRRTDKKYRVASDTFAILFPQTSLENAQIVHERVKPLLHEYSRLDGEPLTIDCLDKSFEVTLENSFMSLDEIRIYLNEDEKK